MKAIWDGTVLAESPDTVVVEGNHYFPRESLHDEFFRPSERTSVCPWKGRASYFDITVDGRTIASAAWTYPTPSAAAADIAGRVAFWGEVRVVDDADAGLRG